MEAPARLGGRVPVSIEVRPCRVATIQAQRARSLQPCLLPSRRRPTLGEYYFNPLLSAYARYEHTDFTSSPDPSGDFVEDEIKIGLKFRR